MSSEDPANSPPLPPDRRGREHARRDALQEDLLRRAYQRSVHRSYIEAALLRTGHAVLSKEPATAPLPSVRKSD
jgi:hypothetical protein